MGEFPCILTARRYIRNWLRVTVILDADLLLIAYQGDANDTLGENTGPLSVDHPGWYVYADVGIGIVHKTL